jgi:hypothetical protein
VTTFKLEDVRMADRLSNIELLVMLSEDVCSQGDDLSREIFERGRAHAQRIRELRVMLDKANQLLTHEEQRFARYLPSPEKRPDSLPRTESLPRVVTKGPQAAG